MKAESFVPNYQIKWNSIIQDEVLLVELPRFIQGEISAEEFVEKMNLAKLGEYFLNLRIAGKSDFPISAYCQILMLFRACVLLTFML